MLNSIKVLQTSLQFHILGQSLGIVLLLTPVLNLFRSLTHFVNSAYMVTNLVFHARTKHIELDYYFVREHVNTLYSILGQPADLLTQSLSKSWILLLRFKLVSFWPSSLQGDVREGVLSKSTVSPKD
ncbi:hypothetical protein DVH24_011973 [Malus domestica]|uniref:Uncharacterized protein n=1 Tax=Malus domestica TaxID=3750 RepID=A0A498JAV7_MALDO|nr:hypothetical protein DVH24_011973 [Malus domestica]